MLDRFRRAEPVRLYLYGLVGPLLAVLLVYGLVDEAQAAVWAAVAAAVLVPGVELARARVSPVGKHRADT